MAERLKEEKYVRHAEVIEVDAGKGKAIVKIDMDEQAFREICEGIMGQEIGTKKDWLLFVQEAAKAKKSYDMYAEAIETARKQGYGVALPTIEDFNPSATGTDQTEQLFWRSHESDGTITSYYSGRYGSGIFTVNRFGIS